MNVVLVWKIAPITGKVSVVNGRLRSLRVAREHGSTRGATFSIPSGSPARVEVVVDEVRIAPGANATVIEVHSDKAEFAFLLRDVQGSRPIWIPEYGVAVTVAGDGREYDQIVTDIRSEGLVGTWQRLEAEPEESFESACTRTRDMKCPTWLGLGRDMRMFRVMHDELAGSWGMIVRAFPISPGRFGQTDDDTYNLTFAIGPGPACRYRITRRLEDDALPILRSVQEEGDVAYHITAFATLETQPLRAAAVRGTDWRAAYEKTYGNMYTAEDRARLKDLIAAETTGRKEEVVCCVRVEAINSGRVPRHAWFKALRVTPANAQTYDGQRGFGLLDAQRVYAVHRLDGHPMPQEEMAVLLQPGERVTLEMLIPHQPLSPARAARLMALDFDRHLEACRRYWRDRLASAAQISVPEPAINARLRAGLLHLDIDTLGLDPRGSTLACVGAYPPIGTESAPIIQYFDSVGWHHLAERCISFFLDRQREDGFIQNFGGYQVETGPVLWTAGEHFRYMRDTAWVRRIAPKLLKSCTFLLNWRRRNMTAEMRTKGCYGLLEGKVADPEDYYHSFMLNAMSCVGIARVAEMLAKINPAKSRGLAREAKAFRCDIRAAYSAALARAPVVPLGDGSWAPAPPPWAEYRGPVALYAEGGRWHYGAFGVSDSLLGPLYLILGEVLGAHEQGATFLLKAHHELMTVDNAALAQPYYCRHDLAHLLRGEVKMFLKAYYNQLASLQDRETYSFWECYTHASQHKTHEEGWFLMQTRWMLWMEDGTSLAFLRGIPRRWLEAGKTISLKNVATYFGAASLTVESHLEQSMITAEVICRSSRLPRPRPRPRSVSVRLPHPQGLRPVSVEGGRFDAATETVRVDGFTGNARIRLHYA